MNTRNSQNTEHEQILKTLKFLENAEAPTQREIARDLDISLGKINYIIRSLVNKGLVKAVRFKNARNKLAYFYVLTPYGMEKKFSLTKLFLKRKLNEYEQLSSEIADLQRELKSSEGISNHVAGK